ncbi:hypothetical protein TWF730_011082 [Orbilia blumenaviensis]|uniref:Uncharacterized protein n=1 Tax=Orbilia blumenaviensis TaxID=1796055 RepID=A0AAV9UMT0_9PEZI
MSERTTRNNKRHCGTDIPPESLEIELDDGKPEDLDLVAIERTWSKRLQQLEQQIKGYTPESIPSVSHESHASEPLARWYGETTTDGFFHDIGKVRKLPKRSNANLNPTHHSRNHQKRFDTYGDDMQSEAGATCGFMSEISRGLSRL